MNTKRQPSKLHPGDKKIQLMLRDDTFRHFNDADDRIIGYLVSEDSRWLPRMPQAPEFIQKFALADNHMLLFTDVQWKFDLEYSYPGVNIWMREWQHEANAYRQSTRQYANDGSEKTWLSEKMQLNDECWMEWQMLRELASPIMVHRLTESRRTALKVLDWCSAKELIQVILTDDDSETQNINVGDFDFTT